MTEEAEEGVRSCLTARTDKKGQATRYTHDPLNRVNRITYADGRTTDFTYDLGGNLAWVNDTVSGEARYTYDSLNRLTSETTDRGVVSYGYDILGRLTERRLNGEDPTVYTYDKANRIKTITYRGKSVVYAYDQGGRLIGRTLPNGLTQSYAYNAVSEITAIAYKQSDGTILEQVNYSYDALGNHLARNRAGATASQQETGFSATYDAANRMLTYNGQPLAYDAHGNLITRQTPQGLVTYTWDARNQLTQISGPNGSAAFKYDHAGRRIEKTINGQTTQYLYDGHQAIAELQGSSIGATYLTGLQIDEVLARYSNQGNRTMLTDALGSVLALTDDTQAAKTSYGYSPFGETATTGETSDNPYQYTGRENDGTGLYYYRARFYAPDLKRFTSPDPIGLGGGWNEAAYVSNNPLRWRDPTGLVLETWEPGEGDSEDDSSGDGSSGLPDLPCFARCQLKQNFICVPLAIAGGGFAGAGGWAIGGPPGAATGAHLGGRITYSACTWVWQPMNCLERCKDKDQDKDKDKDKCH